MSPLENSFENVSLECDFDCLQKVWKYMENNQ